MKPLNTILFIYLFKVLQIIVQKKTLQNDRQMWMTLKKMKIHALAIYT